MSETPCHHKHLIAMLEGGYKCQNEYCQQILELESSPRQPERAVIEAARELVNPLGKIVPAYTKLEDALKALESAGGKEAT